MNSRYLISVLMGIATTYACAATAAEKTAEALYQTNCSSCHGVNLNGGLGGSLIDRQWKYGSSHEAITKVITNGVIKSGMPAWKKSLSEKEIRALVIYILEQEFKASESQLSETMAPEHGTFMAGGHSFVLRKVADANGVLWSMDFLPDGSFLAAQKDGVLWHFAKGNKTAVRGLPKLVDSLQGGLLEVKAHPDYKDNGWIYITYAEDVGVSKNNRKASMTAVARGKIEDGKWTQHQTLFSVDKSLHTTVQLHFGSRLVFKDGYIYFTLGDRGVQHLAQDLSRVNGKIFRLHEDGKVPNDNPFVNDKQALPAIWSYGHRNPQGLDIDPTNGSLWASEHGPRGGDEINLIEKGKNYGWPIITHGMNYDGTPITEKTTQEGMQQPAHFWVPSIAVSAITFYTGDKFIQWKNKLLVGSLKNQEVHLLSVNNGHVVDHEIILKDQGRIRDIANGPDGSLFLVINNENPANDGIFELKPVNTTK